MAGSGHCSPYIPQDTKVHSCIVRLAGSGHCSPYIHQDTKVHSCIVRLAGSGHCSPYIHQDTKVHSCIVRLAVAGSGHCSPYIHQDTKVHSHSVDPQKNRRNYLITLSILKFPTPRRSSLQRRSFYIYISAVGSKNKKSALLYTISVVWHTVHMYYVVFYAYAQLPGGGGGGGGQLNANRV